MLIDDFNLKAKVKISNAEYDLELFSIDQGNITEFKFDDVLFRKVEVEQKTNIIEQKPNTVEQKDQNHRRWTKAEDEILIKYYKKYSSSKIVKKHLLPGRSKSAIDNRVNQIGIKKTKPYYNRIIHSKSINFNNRILASYKLNVYEQCFNHLIFKLQDFKTFGNNDVLDILVGWYNRVLEKHLDKKTHSTRHDYAMSYIQYGLDHNYFEKINRGIYRIKRGIHEDVVKTSEIVTSGEKTTIEDKPTITVVNTDGTPVPGFLEHKNRRIKEIRDNKKKFPNLVKPGGF